MRNLGLGNKMCNQCNLKPVYEFTNQRKLCKSCFIRWFQKKVLYVNRRFGLIKNGDVVSYVKRDDFRSVVLEDVLKMIGEKGFVEIVEFPSKITKKKKKGSSGMEPNKLSSDYEFFKISKYLNVLVDLATSRARMAEWSTQSVVIRCPSGCVGSIPTPGATKKFKLAIPVTVDLEANEIIDKIVNGDIKKIKALPIEGNVIKPLYLFLDKEVLLYAKLRGLKFEGNSYLMNPPSPSSHPPRGQRIKIKSEEDVEGFINNLETKHPEVKRSIVNSYLELFG